MTLYYFLKNEGILPEKKVASLLGQHISEFYLSEFKCRPPKTTIPEIDGVINDYPDVFLHKNTDFIIQFLTEKYKG